MMSFVAAAFSCAIVAGFSAPVPLVIASIPDLKQERPGDVDYRPEIHAACALCVSRSSLRAGVLQPSH